MMTLMAGIALSLIVSTVVVGAIAGPLHALLGEVCETERRSRFWLIYTGLVLYMAPMLAVIIFGLPQSAKISDVDLLRRLLASSLTAVLITLLTVAYQVKGARSHERARPLQREARFSVLE